MAQRRTAGMIVIGILSILIGLMGLVLSVGMVLEGLGVDVAFASMPGTAKGPIVAAFGLARLVVCFALIASGFGMFSVSPRARRIAIRVSVAWLVLNVVEPLVLGYPMTQVLAGSLYPILLLVVFNLPGWRAAFAPAAAARPAEAA